MTLQIEPTTLLQLQTHRQGHFARLQQPPELYVELLVPTSAACDLRVPEGPAGHVLVTPDGTLIELALTAAGCRRKEELFLELCQALRIRRAFCYSFDSTLISVCVASGAAAVAHGMLWRDYVPGQFASLPSLRPAVERDIEAILPHRENLFDTEEQVLEWVRSGWTYVLDEGKELVGVGLCSPVWPGTPQRDVGVMVHPARRGLGHGQRIIASLAERCLRQGLVPTAGCAQDNVASQRTLLRAGFVSRHSVIRFDLGILGSGDGRFEDSKRRSTAAVGVG